MPACDFSGMPFVIHSNGHWIKNDGLDFYVELVSEVIKERKVLEYLIMYFEFWALLFNG